MSITYYNRIIIFNQLEIIVQKKFYFTRRKNLRKLQRMCDSEKIQKE